MEQERPYMGTHLFTVRLWVENIGEPPEHQPEWRGKLSHVAGGTTWHFRDWNELLEILKVRTADLLRSPPMETEPTAD